LEVFSNVHHPRAFEDPGQIFNAPLIGIFFAFAILKKTENLGKSCVLVFVKESWLIGPA